MDSNTSEKITINTNVVDLGYIDLLVSEGFYTNRTDFIRTAIRNQLNNHKIETSEIVHKKQLIMGIVFLSKKELLEIQSKNLMLDYKVLGMFVIPEDIPLELIKKTIGSITVYGVVKCSKEVKELYSLKL